MADPDFRSDDSISVLFVDDEPRFAEMAATYLERRADRLAVQVERDPRAVLDRLEATPVDCVVSDYQMPEMDGLALFEAVRNGFPTLPFVLFTRKNADEIGAKAVDAGVDDYLQKGTATGQFTVLAHRIAALVERRRLERDLRALERAGGVDAETGPRRADGERWTRSDRRPETPASEAIVETVAEREGVDPGDLTPPLYEAVDPDALDALVGPTAGRSRGGLESVTIAYCGYSVTVDGDGRVTLDEPSRESESRNRR